MDHLKNKKGISLVALSVTIIVIMILLGIGIMISHNLLMDKVIAASNGTIESYLKEQIELALTSTQLTNWLEKSKHLNQILKEELEKVENVTNVEIEQLENKDLAITLSYQNRKYYFKVLDNRTVRLYNPLKGNVKIGDYINYPIEYTDVYSKKSYTSTNGWRVIDDGFMEGTTGYVKIISTGVPGKWYYNPTIYENNKMAINRIINDFENITLIDDVNGGIEKQGKEFKVEEIASKITTLTLGDLNQVYNNFYSHKPKRALNDTSDFEDEYELFKFDVFGYFYWLATEKENSKYGIYYMSCIGMQHIESKFEIGIRPVVYLKKGLEGELEDHVWKIKK